MSDTNELREDTGPRGLLDSFIEGMRECSVRTAVGPVILAVVQIALCALWVDEERLSRSPASAWVSSDSDWDAHATVRALQIKYQQSQTPTVVITGDSLILEALDDPARMPRQLQSLGVEVEVANLATDAQTIWETAQVLDQLPEDFHGAVVLSISPTTMTHGRAVLESRVKSPRMALESGAFRDEMNRLGIEARRPTGIYFFDHGHFFAARVTNLRWWLQGGRPPNPHYVTEYFFPRWDAAEWEEKEPHLHRLVHLDNLEAMEGVLDRTLDRLKRRDKVRIALLNMPLHPRTLEVLSDEINEYERRMRRIAGYHGVDYWDLRDEAALVAEDFFDYGHLGSDDARQRFQQALVQRVARLVTGDTGNGS